MANTPNILFLFPDQHRHDWIGARSDLPLNTPNLDGLADRGMLFTNCYTPSPVCSPARACLAHGQRYTRTNVRGNGDITDPDRDCYYRVLRKAGYQVGGVGKFDLDKPSLSWGLDGQKCFEDYGFTHGCNSEGKGDAIISYTKNHGTPMGPYMHHLEQNGLADQHVAMYHDDAGNWKGLCYSAITPLPDAFYSDNWIGQKALDTLNSFEPDAPWHLVINWTGPHDPYDVTAAMHARWQDTAFPAAHQNTKDDPKEISLRRQHYAAMIENIDRQIGELLDWLDAHGQLQNTLIVYSSDHGEMLGDHNRWGKCHWRDASARVPLIVAGPGVQPGIISDTLVSIHDLAALFCDVSGSTVPQSMDARSFLPVLVGDEAVHRDHLAVGLSEWRMIVTPEHKFVVDHQCGDHIFDRIKDPQDDHNLINDESLQEKLSGARTLIEAEIPFN